MVHGLPGEPRYCGAACNPHSNCNTKNRLSFSVRRAPANATRKPGSPPGSQELLDGVQDRFAVGNAAGDHALLLVRQLVDVLKKLPRSIGALHLAVTEQVELGQQLLVEQLDALGAVVAPVVAVRKMEGIDVPLVGAESLLDDLVAQLVSGADLGAAGLAGVR